MLPNNKKLSCVYLFFLLQQASCEILPDDKHRFEKNCEILPDTQYGQDSCDILPNKQHCEESCDILPNKQYCEECGTLWDICRTNGILNSIHKKVSGKVLLVQS